MFCLTFLPHPESSQLEYPLNFWQSLHKKNILKINNNFLWQLFYFFPANRQKKYSRQGFKKALHH